MERVRANWLQKAVAIAAGALLAIGLAALFTPAKAWAETETTPAPEVQIMAAPAGTVTGVAITGYSNPVAGEFAYANKSRMQVTYVPSEASNDIAFATFGWWEAGGSDPYSFAAGGNYFLEIRICLKETSSYAFDSNPNVSIDGGAVIDSAVVQYSTEDGFNNMLVITTKSYTVPSNNYEMTSGNGATWTKGSSTGLTFVSNAPFSEFADPYGAVVINDEAVDAQNYTAEEGSTKITLKPEYLETLEPDEYRISIASKNGVAQGTFTVKAAGESNDESDTNADTNAGTNDSKTSPKTGTERTPLAAASLICALGVLASGAYVLRSRKKGVK